MLLRSLFWFLQILARKISGFVMPIGLHFFLFFWAVARRGPVAPCALNQIAFN